LFGGGFLCGCVFLFVFFLCVGGFLFVWWWFFVWWWCLCGGVFFVWW